MHRSISIILTSAFILIFCILLLRFVWRDPEKQATLKRQFHKIKSIGMKAKASEPPETLPGP